MKKFIISMCSLAMATMVAAQEPVVVESRSQRETSTSQPAQTTAYSTQNTYSSSYSSYSYDDRANHWSLGVNFNTGTRNPVWAFGMGVNLQYFATEDFRIEAAYNGYFRRADWASWDVNLNLHYLIEVADQLELYPILGGTFGHAQYKIDPAPVGEDGKQKEGAFGINIGAGLQYSINEHLVVKAEGYWKYLPTRELEPAYRSLSSRKFGQRTVATVGFNYLF